METKEETLNYLNNGGSLFSVVGKFDNVHGEEFIIYQVESRPYYFITGDEFSWEIGWRFEPESGTVYKTFLITEDEIKAARKVITG